MRLSSRQYLIYLALLICIDQASKYTAANLIDISLNAGLLLGIGKGFLSSSIITILSILAVAIISTYIFFLNQLGPKYKKVKIALTFLTAGVTGNVLDRVIIGRTIDFIPGINSTFNIADIYITGSIAFIMFLMFSKRENVFFDNSLRAQLIVNKKEQIRMGRYFLMASILSSLFCGVFVYTFLKYNQLLSIENLNQFIFLFAMLSIFTGVFFFGMGVLLSHKSIGALFAFEKYTKELIDGKDREFTLRENDDFKHLIPLAQKLRERLSHDK